MRSEELQRQTLPSAQTAERGLHIRKKAWKGGKPWKKLDDYDRKRMKWQFPGQKTRQYTELDIQTREPQAFHAKLHKGVLENIMKTKPLLRGMPVYDSTFDLVQSGKNLLIEAPGPVRTLQYLLPLTHNILLDGDWRRERRPKLESSGQGPERPPELLVICPSLDDAHEVQDTGTRLFKSSGVGLEFSVLDQPMKTGLRRQGVQGCNILTSTPEVLLQCLALQHARARLVKILEHVKTLVVDGEAGTMRRPDFLDTLGGVMEDIPLQQGTQRIVISDKHDPVLDKRLRKMVLTGKYELHHEPRFDETLTLREEERLRGKEERIKRREEYREEQRARSREREYFWERSSS